MKEIPLLLNLFPENHIEKGILYPNKRIVICKNIKEAGKVAEIIYKIQTGAII